MIEHIISEALSAASAAKDEEIARLRNALTEIAEPLMQAGTIQAWSLKANLCQHLAAEAIAADDETRKRERDSAFTYRWALRKEKERSDALSEGRPLETPDETQQTQDLKQESAGSPCEGAKTETATRQAVEVREALTRVVSGCVRTCIDAHGDIGRAQVASAAKRIVGQLLAVDGLLAVGIAADPREYLRRWMAEKPIDEHPVCLQCGGPHLFDTSVPSPLWNRVIRGRGLPDYLCTTCIVRAFAEAGESFTAELWSADIESFGGLPIRVDVGPSRTRLEQLEQDAEYAEVAAALSAASAAKDWQDIATAPKDGSRIVAWCEQPNGPEYRVLFYRDDWAGWFSLPGLYRSEPTHWMPLYPPSEAR